MQVKLNNVLGSTIVLKRLLGGELLEPITIAAASFTNGVCKAGTPLAADGTIANSGSAVGILLQDTYAENPNGSLVKAFAVIDKAAAEASYGSTYAEALLAALTNLVFE